MDVSTFYALFSATCFTLTGLWWSVVEKHRHWLRDPGMRRRVGSVYLAFLLPADRAGAPGVAVYSLGLALMAATAWLSRFPRYRVGIGAVLFAVSDLLIFARMGPLADSPLPDLLIWPLYYFGQFLICTGVVGELRARSCATT